MGISDCFQESTRILWEIFILKEQDCSLNGTNFFLLNLNPIQTHIVSWPKFLLCLDLRDYCLNLNLFIKSVCLFTKNVYNFLNKNNHL